VAEDEAATVEEEEDDDEELDIEEVGGWAAI